MTSNASVVANQLQHLVVDAGAIIKGQGFNFPTLAQSMCTVPEVLAEIRDSRSRDLLESLPFRIETRIPSEKSMRAVAEFAKKTGDFAALSLTDLKLIALLHTLEVEVNGEKFIRSEPKGKPIRAPTSSAPKSAPKPQTSPVSATSASSAPNQAAESPAVADTAAADESDTAVLPAEEDDESEGSSEESDDEEAPTATAAADEDEEGVDIAGKAVEGDLSCEPGQLEGYFPSLAESLRLSREEAVDEEDEEEVENILVDEMDVTIVDGRVVGLVDQCSNHLNHSHWSDLEMETALQSGDWKQVGATGAGKAAAKPEGGQSTSAIVSNASSAAPVRAWGAPKSWATIAAQPASEPAPTSVINAVTNGLAKVVISKEYESTALSTASVADEQPEQAPVSVKLEPAQPASTPAPVKLASSEQPTQYTSRILSSSGGGGGRVASAIAAAQDDGSGWINTDNIASVRAHGGGLRAEKPRTSTGKTEHAKTACITSDFAMQNVIIQMGLNVMSVDGLIIRSVKQFVLMCIGCKTVHYDMDRLFCTKCGGSHLCRVGASVDSRTGELRLHLKKNYHYDLRGTKFSMPLPGKAEKYQGELLLREDQLMSGVWRQKCVKIRRDVRSAFGEDIATDVGVHVNKGGSVVVGYGRRNPNEEKGRERRGKKKKNH